MPYILKDKRQKIYDTEFFKLSHAVIAREKIDCAGDLNYVFTMLIKDYIKHKGLDYQAINDVVGALEGAKAEFQRRVVVPYEVNKIMLNGDVY